MTVDHVALPDDAIRELSEVAAIIEGAQAELPGVEEIGPTGSRVRQAQMAAPPLDRARTRTAEAAGHRVEVRYVEPDTPSGAHLHVHGGGWVGGSATAQDPHLAALADATSCRVASVEYRLAPEHRLDDQVDDVVAAARWLAGCAESDPITVGGESAGAHLALLAVLRLRDEGSGDLVGAASLRYGPYDLTMTPSAREWTDRTLVLSTPGIAWTIDQVLGPDGDPTSPQVSPLRADLGGLPPILLTVGDDDPLLDDSLLLHDALVAAGVDVRLDRYEGAFHAFDLFPIVAAGVAADRQHRFLREARP